jgi:hypothetical protein|tara:strand:+ start:349 stop:594 length:246 start_codon:yes stop_codon:yes gene_type:complete
LKEKEKGGTIYNNIILSEIKNFFIIWKEKSFDNEKKKYNLPWLHPEMPSFSRLHLWESPSRTVHLSYCLLDWPYYISFVKK